LYNIFIYIRGYLKNAANNKYIFLDTALTAICSIPFYRTNHFKCFIHNAAMTKELVQSAVPNSLLMVGHEGRS